MVFFFFFDGGLFVLIDNVCRVHRKRNRSPGEVSQSHVDAFSDCIDDIKHILSHRNSLVDRDSDNTITLGDALCKDVKKCARTAELFVKAEDHFIYEFPDSSSSGVSTMQGDSSANERSASRKGGKATRLIVRTKELANDPATAGAAGDAATGDLHQNPPSVDLDDPEPGFKERYPPTVYAELIFALQQEVQRELKAGNFPKAEAAHLKAITYSEERERHWDIPFANRSAMNETLAEIYVKSNQLDNAKSMLSDLLKQESTDSDRKWKLYHTLAEVYLEQKRLPEAEKYAKRAYIGREGSLGKGHGLILQSASLLVQICEAKGEPEEAQAFRNMYEANTHSTIDPPQISKHIGTRRVQWNPDLSVDINEVNKFGSTPLITAITCGDEDMLQRVLQNGADLELCGPDGVSPLMHAVSRGHEKIAGVLLSRGADVDLPSSDWTSLHRATDMGDIPMMKLLLANNADIEAKAPKRFATPRRRPSSDPRPSMESSVSDEADSDDSDSALGWTPLLRACQNGKDSVARLLIDSGAYIEAQNPSMATPLICAVESQNEALVELLLTRGANVEAEDEFGWKALHRTTINRGSEAVAQLLLDHDADINAICDHKKTPLHYAVEKDDEAMVSFLLRSGADISAVDIALRTPLHTAIEHRLEQMVYILLEYGADSAAKDKAGRDALSLATHTRRKSPEIVKLLNKHKHKRISSIAPVGAPLSVLPSSHSTASTVVPSTSSPIAAGGSSSWWRKSLKKKDR